MSELKKEITNMASLAARAARQSQAMSSDTKNQILREMADALLANKNDLLKANKVDLKAAKSNGLSRPMLERLTLDEKRIQEMADSLIEIAALPDPVGEVIKAWRRPNGLWIHKVRVPIGVIAIIYESRPNVTSDCLGLCFKSGNSVILRGGSEALNSNLAIYKILKAVLKNNRVPEELANMIKTPDRKAVDELLKLNQYIDLVMPRGGEELIKKIVKSSRIPVIKHYKGVCHVYVDDWAELNMATDICLNAKLQRPGVCNAMESLLVHKDSAIRFLPGMLKKFDGAQVEIRGCDITRKICKNLQIKKATEKDYATEYSGLIISVKVVESLEDAIEHINTYGSHHSDTIVTDNYDNALKFLRFVDSACVYVNASTRFTDGNQFGLGAEIGISTDKLHARGPMGLEELCSYKYMVFGHGQVRL
jgi:glutamate-5-semialdehyde dehydrogenase